MKKSQKEVSRDDPDQSERFIAAAKELGSDESGKPFERALKKVAPKPKAARKRVKKSAKE